MSLKQEHSLIFDVFSHRQKFSDQKYKPDHLSPEFRNRIIHLYNEIASGNENPESDLLTFKEMIDFSKDRRPNFIAKMHQQLLYLYGRLERLSDDSSMTEKGSDLLTFLKRCNTENFFDFIELTFKMPRDALIILSPNQVVRIVNENFDIEKIPYRLTHLEKIEKRVFYPRIIRAEDKLIHQEAIEPALFVLSRPYFGAANMEFRDALNQYRRGNYIDCLTKCGSTFESVLKVLCERNNWPLEKDTTGYLLNIVVQNSPLNPFFEQPLLLIATMRNKLSGAHGGGSEERKVERPIAQYAVSSTAAAIVLLVHKADRAT